MIAAAALCRQHRERGLRARRGEVAAKKQVVAQAKKKPALSAALAKKAAKKRSTRAGAAVSTPARRRQPPRASRAQGGPSQGRTSQGRGAAAPRPAASARAAGRPAPRAAGGADRVARRRHPCAAGAGPRRAALSRYVSVTAREFSLTLSRPLVGAGGVTVELRNYGEDPHDLVVSTDGSGDRGGALGRDRPRSGRQAKDVALSTGRYKLFCSLGGTSSSA